MSLLEDDPMSSAPSFVQKVLNDRMKHMASLDVVSIDVFRHWIVSIEERSAAAGFRSRSRR